MTDLVKRLRYEQDRLDDEAASRIEELELLINRAAADAEISILVGTPMHLDWLKDAHAALEKKDG